LGGSGGNPAREATPLSPRRNQPDIYDAARSNPGSTNQPAIDKIHIPALPDNNAGM
jgi:hypothetical protein